MITQKILKLRKYLFLISVMFLFISFGHILYLYLYEDAEIIPVKGGTVSEGLIGNFPSLNPIKNLSGNNQYVVNLLYRSLLRYDLEQGKIVGDIANCDISTLVNIECYINENAKWSNGENITAEDIYATYELIKSSNSNIILISLLENTKIEYDGNIIKFNNNKQDVNFLNVFFQPILAKSVIDTLTPENISGNFPVSSGLYSGDFQLSNVSSDLTLGVSKITLDKNDFYNISNISRVILNIFPNANSFQKNGQSINIFNDTENIVGRSIPRLESYKYVLPQFVGLFINQDKISNQDLRTYIFNKINPSNLIELLGKNDFVEINNPYLTETSILKEPNVKNFDSIMSSLGYLKKSQLIENLRDSGGEENKNIVVDDGENISILNFQEDSKYISSPESIEKYNFITKDNILLEGKVDPNTEEVWFNDYKLTGFSKGDNNFRYRLRVSYDSIKEGRNDYKLYFVLNGEKVLKEEVFFMYYPNENTLNEEKEKFVQELYENYKNEKEETENKNASAIITNQSQLERLNKLDENTYYNNDLVPFTLSLYYIDTDKNIDKTANFVKSSLKELGIEVNLVPFTLNDLTRILTNKNEYDMIISGVNLGYFEFNIFPYFHSGQSESGYNFSNIRKTSLDLLLEELKSNILNEEKVVELESKVLDILKEEQVIKTLYTPKDNLLVDKNLKIERAYERLPARYLRSYVLNYSYTKDEKIVNYENKSFVSFFKFIFRKLYE